MGFFVYAGFFIAVFTMPIYGGAAYDKNGYQPFAAPVQAFARLWDVNITVFSVMSLILIAGTVSILAAS